MLVVLVLVVVLVSVVALVSIAVLVLALVLGLVVVLALGLVLGLVAVEGEEEGGRSSNLVITTRRNHIWLERFVRERIGRRKVGISNREREREIFVRGKGKEGRK